MGTNSDFEGVGICLIKYNSGDGSSLIINTLSSIFDDEAFWVENIF